MTRTAMSLLGLPILVPQTAGSARLLSSTGSCERRCPGSNFSSRDLVCRTECHSTSERGSRGEDETAVPCSTDPWSQPPNRTSLSTSYEIHSGVYRIYRKSTGAMSKGQPAESGKESRPDDVPPRPFQLPLFFSSHPPPRGALELELRRRRHTGGLQRSVDTITSHIPDPPAGHVCRSHWRYQRGEHGRQRDRPRRTADPSRCVWTSLQIM